MLNFALANTSLEKKWGSTDPLLPRSMSEPLPPSTALWPSEGRRLGQCTIGKGKIKVNVDLYSASSWSHL